MIQEEKENISDKKSNNNSPGKMSTGFKTFKNFTFVNNEQKNKTSSTNNNKHKKSHSYNFNIKLKNSRTGFPINSSESDENFNQNDLGDIFSRLYSSNREVKNNKKERLKKYT